MDEDSIDIENLLSTLDSQGMAGFTQAFFTDFEKGMDAVNPEHLPWLPELQKQTWNGVLCLGMGGSAAGGDFLSTLSSHAGETPFITHRDYTIPSWWNPSWLVLATSHSGNTEETVHATETALKQGATVIVIATGGMLAGLCELYENCYLIPSIGGQPPRTAFGHLFSRQLACMQHLGILPRQSEEEYGAMMLRLHYASDANDFRKEEGSDILALAKALSTQTLALLGPEELQPVLIRFKNQINENSGRFARIGAVPEMNHNEIVAWGGIGADGDPAREEQAVLFITWDGISPQVRKRVDWMIEHTPTDFAWKVHGEGPSLLEAMLHHCIVMDWLTIALALIHGKDPAAIAPILALKGHLAS
jgi:glucose/mannose-6-phosphate isomerase